MKRLLTTAAACTLLPLALACQHFDRDADDHGDHAMAAATDASVQLVEVANSGVSGTLRIEELADGLRITGRIEGLKPGEHGFHVHTFGDLSDREKGESAGGHFSTEGHQHGRPTDGKRHVGDLGNIRADQNGVAMIDIVDGVIALSGENSILGRALVVHADPDQFVQPTGNAGGRVAFGVIGIADASAATGSGKAGAR
jgi:Cu-Zn family superoxide dismutase